MIDFHRSNGCNELFKGGEEMDYVKMVEETINLFKNLAATSDKKGKQELLNGVKDNAIAQKMLSLLKEKSIHLKTVPLSEPVAMNESRVRLQNYLNFVQSLLRMNGEMDSAAMQYVLLRTDSEEQLMYKAVLTNKETLLPIKKEERAKSKRTEKKKIEELEEPIEAKAEVKEI